MSESGADLAGVGTRVAAAALVVVRMGVDLVHVPRVEALLERQGERFLSRVFTGEERGYCMGYSKPGPHLAARFAAKEAAMKALGTGLASGVTWTDVSVHRSGVGEPTLVMVGRAREIAEGLGASASMVSLSHTGDYAMATVLLGRALGGA